MVIVVETSPKATAKRTRTTNGKTATRPELPLDYAVPRDPNMTFSREEIYGEWGR
jgi:hypothetical protein